jgi:hypothetical protein
MRCVRTSCCMLAPSLTLARTPYGCEPVGSKLKHGVEQRIPAIWPGRRHGDG